VFLSSAIASNPFCVAHRSLGYGEKESSLSAFSQAAKTNVAVIEFDLNHTQDGETLVYHDEILRR